MKIITREFDPMVRGCDTVKFVLQKSDTEQQLTIATPFSGEHIRLLSKDATLIGAGTITSQGSNIEATWGSGSCLQRLGYDRPENPDDANTVLAEVRGSFEDWIKNI